MVRWVDIALEEGVRFFVTSLGNPRWVVEKATRVGGIVYHDVTERKWADKGLDAGVHGLIAVNRARRRPRRPQGRRGLWTELGDLGLPLICAGGIGDAQHFVEALRIGYAGVQMGTRFIATPECNASDAYKQAIVDAHADDIVLTERLTGVPVAVINTPYIQRMGSTPAPLRGGCSAAGTGSTGCGRSMRCSRSSSSSTPRWTNRAARTSGRRERAWTASPRSNRRARS